MITADVLACTVAGPLPVLHHMFAAAEDIVESAWSQHWSSVNIALSLNLSGSNNTMPGIWRSSSSGPPSCIQPGRSAASIVLATYTDFEHGYSSSDISDIFLRRWIVSQIMTCQHGRRPFYHHCLHQYLSHQGRYRAGVLRVLTIGHKRWTIHWSQ